MTPTAILYDQKHREIASTVLKLNKQVNTLSLSRLFVILGGGALLFYTFQLESLPLVFFCFFALLFLFAYLVRKQSQLELQKNYFEAYLKVLANEQALADGKLNMYDHGQHFENGAHPYSSDMDVFGTYSLFAQINRATTKQGIDLLASWLDAPLQSHQIQRNQEASQELENESEWIWDFQAKLLANLNHKLDIKAFLINYFQDRNFQFGNAFMRVYIKVGPVLFLVALVGSFFVPKLAGVATLIGLFHILWALAKAGSVSIFSSRIDKIGGVLGSYADAIQSIEDHAWNSIAMQEIAGELKQNQGTESISLAFKKLAGLINNLDARNNVFVGIFLNLFLLWDFRQVLAIVDWKNKYEHEILNSFDTLAKVEAVTSLAIWKRNHSSYIYPVILDNPLENKIEAQGLYHPLIPSNQVVANDYSSIDHRVALVTGSNMAGKSTFLRTVGINAILAYAGAAVAAASFQLPIYKLISYMRIKDNLNESTSTFKAELNRMKFILDTVSAHSDSFFLIDEMLRGTNSVDKYLGSRAIIKKLVRLDGKGMVATHDLQLSSLQEEFPEDIKNYHFDIRVDEGQMLFDYKLKIGECKIFNASLLLKGIGVDIDENME
ncbi:DNA mismatch repair protein MutS [Sphingobacterium sp.]|uniref:MutS-related protein n=1 Tax=Sphingobacterium sp. TaxID=341027 RepID=UPI00258E2DD0|nr:DNA mismatch repair protein MutS [Sphingobacterium sp.]WET71569.1 MAG: DNA mismatch repair protein MutS [Sphingobacterium sp.]